VAAAFDRANYQVTSVRMVFRAHRDVERADRDDT
jgi:hypothetical protein